MVLRVSMAESSTQAFSYSLYYHVHVIFELTQKGMFGDGMFGLCFQTTIFRF